MTKSRWTRWRAFPDPTVGDYLSAPFGPGVYELRNRKTGEFVLVGESKNVAHRMSSLLPLPLGTKNRQNEQKRNYVFENIAEIEYRTKAYLHKRDAKNKEKKLLNSKEYLFPT